MQPMTDELPTGNNNDGDRTQGDRGHLVRWAVWLASVVGLVWFVALARVDTYLGVEAVSWDKRGEDYVWRVWWRARDDLIEVNPAWAFEVAYVAATALFAGATILGLWLLLVPDRDDAKTGEIDLGSPPATVGTGAE